MLRNKSKKFVIEFLNELEERNQVVKNERLKKFIQETLELVENNEYGIGLEILLENLYEFEIPLNRHLVEIAKAAILEMKMSWEEWSVIEELIKE